MRISACAAVYLYEVLHLVTSPIGARIRQAIAQKRLIEVAYKAGRRIAEPHDYGRIAGTDRLLIFQLRPARGWRMLDVPKIESLTILDGTFAGSRGNPRQGHHSWDEIYARVG